MKGAVFIFLFVFDLLCFAQGNDIKTVKLDLGKPVFACGWKGKGILYDYAAEKIRYNLFNGCQKGKAGCFDDMLVILGENDTAIFALAFRTPEDTEYYEGELIFKTKKHVWRNAGLFGIFPENKKVEYQGKHISYVSFEKKLFSKFNRLWNKYKLDELKALSFEVNSEAVSWVAKAYSKKLNAEFTFDFDFTILCTVGGLPGGEGWTIGSEPSEFPYRYAFYGFRLNLPAHMKAGSWRASGCELTDGKDTLFIKARQWKRGQPGFRALKMKKKEDQGTYGIEELYENDDLNEQFADKYAKRKNLLEESRNLQTHKIYSFYPKANESGRTETFLITDKYVISISSSVLGPRRIEKYKRMMSTLRKVQ